MAAVYYQHDAGCHGCSELFYSLTSISPLGTRLSTRGPPIIWVMSQRLQLPPGVARPQGPNTLLSHTIRTWRNMFTSYPHMDYSVVKKSRCPSLSNTSSQHHQDVFGFGFTYWIRFLVQLGQKGPHLVFSEISLEWRQLADWTVGGGASGLVRSTSHLWNLG